MQNTDEINVFIIDNVTKHSKDIVNIVANEYRLSRQRAHKYVSALVNKQILIKIGENRWTKYYLANGNFIEFTNKIKDSLKEDEVWTRYIKPWIKKYSENIYKICYFGFTEMYNNAIDHSEGKIIYVSVGLENEKIKINIIDNGVGIFNKIKKTLNLESAKESILHLSKGKFTTDPKNHTGEGIFFTSRVFDIFSIFSSDILYQFYDEDWVLSNEKENSFGKGTFVSMEISVHSKNNISEVFNRYTDEDYKFDKTVVAVSLSGDPDDFHVSRSQAKRLLMGLEKFLTIVLNFKNVDSVGRAFIDEIFRVFQNEHPNIKIHYINCNEEVEKMIKGCLSEDNQG